MSNYEPGQTGAVKDPENDGRLKENREAGVTKGTTEHTKEAPHVNERGDGNADSEKLEAVSEADEEVAGE